MLAVFFGAPVEFQVHSDGWKNAASLNRIESCGVKALCRSGLRREAKQLRVQLRESGALQSPGAISSCPILHCQHPPNVARDRSYCADFAVSCELDGRHLRSKYVWLRRNARKRPNLTRPLDVLVVEREEPLNDTFPPFFARMPGVRSSGPSATEVSWPARGLPSLSGELCCGRALSKPARHGRTW